MVLSQSVNICILMSGSHKWSKAIVWADVLKASQLIGWFWDHVLIMLPVSSTYGADLPMSLLSSCWEYFNPGLLLESVLCQLLPQFAWGCVHCSRVADYLRERERERDTRSVLSVHTYRSRSVVWEFTLLFFFGHRYLEGWATIKNNKSYS